MSSIDPTPESEDQRRAFPFDPAGPLLRIYVEQFLNKDVRKFHLSIPVADRPFSRHGRDFPELANELSARLDDAPAVSDETIFKKVGRKSIHVTINKAFSWDECIAQVLDVLASFYAEHHGISGVIADVGPPPPCVDQTPAEGAEVVTRT